MNKIITLAIALVLLLPIVFSLNDTPECFEGCEDLEDNTSLETSKENKKVILGVLLFTAIIIAIISEEEKRR